MIGRTLSHYKVLEEIPRGGRGIVCRAPDLKLERGPQNPLAYLKVTKSMFREDLRSDPWFDELARRMKLPTSEW